MKAEAKVTVFDKEVARFMVDGDDEDEILMNAISEANEIPIEVYIRFFNAKVRIGSVVFEIQQIIDDEDEIKEVLEKLVRKKFEKLYDIEVVPVDK